MYLSFYLICFDGGIDAELFASEKSAIFLILPEEDTTKNFVASLMIQNLARELFSVANEFVGFAPNSKTAETLSKNMGNRTVLSGQVSHSTKDATEMLQMMQRPLMTADELKSMSNGSFVVMKTGSYPMRTRLKMFFEWGIRFDKPLTVKENALRRVNYASKAELEEAIRMKYPNVKTEIPAPEMTPLEVHLQEQEKQPDGLITKTDKKLKRGIPCETLPIFTKWICRIGRLRYISTLLIEPTKTASAGQQFRLLPGI